MARVDAVEGGETPNELLAAIARWRTTVVGKLHHLTGHDPDATLGGGEAPIASGDAEIGSTAVFERSLGQSMRDHAGRGRPVLAPDT